MGSTDFSSVEIAGTSSTILVVDDMAENLRILDTILTEAGYEVRLALSGKAALRYVENNLPDLILLDIRMPGMDGFKVSKILKSEQQTQGIPIIFITALNDLKEKIRGFRLGAVDFITKPFEREELLARVNAQLMCQSFKKKLEAKHLELLESNRLREEVERIIHHDLRGLLLPILHFPKKIKKNNYLSKREHNELNLLERAGHRLLKLISRTSDLMLMEKGAYRFEPVPVDVLLIINDILSEYSNPIQDLNLVVKVLINNRRVEETDSFQILGEMSLIYTMLENLIRNAVEASEKRQSITISLKNGSSPRVTIHNDALVPPEIREVFFKKYVTHGKNKGTGLGTYSAKLAAETLGGTVMLSSEWEEGTTVEIYLPAVPKNGFNRAENS